MGRIVGLLFFNWISIEISLAFLWDFICDAGSVPSSLSSPLLHFTHKHGFFILKLANDSFQNYTSILARKIVKRLFLCETNGLTIFRVGQRVSARNQEN